MHIKSLLRIIILCTFCLISLQSSTIHTPQIIQGYIDRMNPTVILLELRNDEIILLDDDIPKNSEEGIWLDVVISKNTYHILGVNEKKTIDAQRRIQRLQNKLRKK